MTNPDDAMTISTDATAAIYNSTLAALARLMPDALIRSAFSTPDSARTFIRSLAYDTNAATDTDADCMIPAYQHILDCAYALDDADLIDDLITALLDADRDAARHLPALDTYLY